MSFHLSVLSIHTHTNTQHSTSWKSSKLLYWIWKASEALCACDSLFFVYLGWVLRMVFRQGALSLSLLYNIIFVIVNGIWEFRLNTLICCWVLLLALLLLLCCCLKRKSATHFTICRRLPFGIPYIVAVA